MRSSTTEQSEVAAVVLRVAREAFAADGYAATSVRTIARNAGVDPALVRYYFGRKDELFRRCLEPPEGLREAIAGVGAHPVERRGEAVVRVVLESWDDEVSGAYLRSLQLSASQEPRASEVLDELFTGAACEALDPRLGLSEDERDERAALAAALLTGLGASRYLWAHEPTASMPVERLVELAGAAAQTYLDGTTG